MAHVAHEVGATDDYVAWAQTWCPEPVARDRISVREGAAIYDSVDERLGDEAEGDDFLTRVLWLETAIRLARVGWTIEALEDARWPLPHTVCAAELMRQMTKERR